MGISEQYFKEVKENLSYFESPHSHYTGRQRSTSHK
jgi:hypothetical protein